MWKLQKRKLINFQLSWSSKAQNIGIPLENTPRIFFAPAREKHENRQKRWRLFPWVRQGSLRQGSSLDKRKSPSSKEPGEGRIPGDSVVVMWPFPPSALFIVLWIGNDCSLTHPPARPPARKMGKAFFFRFAIINFRSASNQVKIILGGSFFFSKSTN